MTLRTLLFALAATALAACTSVDVRRVDPQEAPLAAVCIERNPKVIVDDFLAVLEQAFQRHRIQVRVVSTPAPEDCEYTVTYTALQSWDVVTFLREAEVRVWKRGGVVGSATYHHAGGYALTKYASTETKMRPVLDELLAGFPTGSAEASR